MQFGPILLGWMIFRFSYSFLCGALISVNLHIAADVPLRYLFHYQCS